MKRLSIVIAFTALVSAPVYAMNDQVQDALINVGVQSAVSWIITNRQTDPSVQRQRQYQSSNRSDYPNFVCNSDPVDCSYQQGIYDRNKDQWDKQNSNAYNCGRYGRDC
jgi:hypothetical protein